MLCLFYMVHSKISLDIDIYCTEIKQQTVIQITYLLEEKGELSP